MPSSYSSRLRLNYQAPGENLNTWGMLLNSGVFQLIEDAMARRLAFSLSGSKVLAAANGLDDEARCMFLDVTGGSGGSITIPALEKLYVVRNAASSEVAISTGAGTAATVKPGETTWVICDASVVRRVQATDFGGERLTGLGAPADPQDAATKAYADGLAFNHVDLPGQGPGSIGGALISDGTSASWRRLSSSDLTDYAADQTARRDELEAFSLVTALIF